MTAACPGAARRSNASGWARLFALPDSRGGARYAGVPGPPPAGLPCEGPARYSAGPESPHPLSPRLVQETPMSATATAAEFIARSRFEDCPPAAVEAARRAVLDCLGVMLAGSREPAARILEGVARAEGGG